MFLCMFYLAIVGFTHKHTCTCAKASSGSVCFLLRIRSLSQVWLSHYITSTVQSKEKKLFPPLFYFASLSSGFVWLLWNEVMVMKMKKTCHMFCRWCTSSSSQLQSIEPHGFIYFLIHWFLISLQTSYETLDSHS